jgi:hypothetical protein
MLNRFFGKMRLQGRWTNLAGVNRDFLKVKKMKLRCTTVLPDTMRTSERGGDHALCHLHVEQSFLDLIASAPTSFFVPTLDIDIAWQ